MAQEVQRVVVAASTGNGIWYCTGCGAELLGGFAHTCQGLNDMFKMSTDPWTLPPDARPLVVREDHDAGDEHVEPLTPSV